MSFNEALIFRDCPWCGLKHAQMKVLNQNAQSISPTNGPRDYTLLACPQCGSPIVVETYTNGSGVKQAVPNQTVGHGVEHLPEDVEGYYSDAIKVLRAGVPDAAAVQLRRTLEAAAAHHGSSDGTLVKRIEKLIADGHVTKSFGAVLHHIRKVGNQGAHATDERLDEPTVDRALRFTTALLRDLFEVPAELAAIEKEAPGGDGVA